MKQPIWWNCGALITAACLVTAAVAQAPSFHKRPKLKPVRVAPAQPGFGEPLLGLDAASLAAFTDGKTEFSAVETVEGGLGPIFNDNACAACHDAGGLGGASARFVTRFGRTTNGVFDPLEALGGSLLQAKAIAPEAQEVVPAQANVTARRITTPVFGAGLIEAIADGDLDQAARRPQPDGVRGRVHWVTDVASGQRRAGRFGWKAQQATLLSFAGDAYLNEMGVTSRLFPKENAPNGRADLLAKYDKVPDVEDAVDPATGQSDIDHAADFMRFLAPPPSLRLNADAVAGQRLFDQAHCTACHTPVLFTANHPNRALSNKPVPLYSDLLLHDMGSLGDGIAQGDAKVNEMRTAPLWGLRVRPALLHDGRATTPRDAIAWHDGQARASRQRFDAMKAAEQQQLLAFLATL